MKFNQSLKLARDVGIISVRFIHDQNAVCKSPKAKRLMLPRKHREKRLINGANSDMREEGLAPIVRDPTRASMLRGFVGIVALGDTYRMLVPAYERIRTSPVKEVVVTDTVPVSPGPQDGKIRVLSVADTLAHTIKNVFEDESVSELFAGENQLF